MLMYVSLIVLVNVLVGVSAYAFITIKELKSSRAMWQQAYTSLTIQSELDKWKAELEKNYNK